MTQRNACFDKRNISQFLNKSRLVRLLLDNTLSVIKDEKAEINERQARREDEFLKVRDSLAFCYGLVSPYHRKGNKTQ